MTDQIANRLHSVGQSSLSTPAGMEENLKGWSKGIKRKDVINAVQEWLKLLNHIISSPRTGFYHNFQFRVQENPNPSVVNVVAQPPKPEELIVYDDAVPHPITVFLPRLILSPGNLVYQLVQAVADHSENRVRLWRSKTADPAYWDENVVRPLEESVKSFLTKKFERLQIDFPVPVQPQKEKVISAPHQLFHKDRLDHKAVKKRN